MVQIDQVYRVSRSPSRHLPRSVAYQGPLRFSLPATFLLTCPVGKRGKIRKILAQLHDDAIDGKGEAKRLDLSSTDIDIDDLKEILQYLIASRLHELIVTLDLRNNGLLHHPYQDLFEEVREPINQFPNLTYLLLPSSDEGDYSFL